MRILLDECVDWRLLRDLPHQQNPATFDIFVIVIRARTTRLPDLQELLPALRVALQTARAGEFRVLSWHDVE